MFGGIKVPSPRGAFRVWQRNLTIFKKYWKSIMFPNFVEPLLYLGALGLGLGAFIQQGRINGQEYVAFIAPGLLASNAMFAASFESTFDTFVKLRFDRVYDAIITTPVNAEDVVAGEYLWAGTRSALYGTAFLLVLVALGLVGSVWAVLIPPALLVIGIMFSVMGTLFTSLIYQIDYFSYYFTLVITPLFLVSGSSSPWTTFRRRCRRSPGSRRSTTRSTCAGLSPPGRRRRCWWTSHGSSSSPACWRSCPSRSCAGA